MRSRNIYSLPGLRLGVLRTVRVALLLLMVAGVLSSCSIAQAVALKDCTYRYDKVDDITFLGMPKSEIVSVTGIYKVTRALVGATDEVPLGFTLYLKVSNPNKRIASVDKIFYSVDLDSIQIAQGSCTENLTVAPESTVILPLRLEMELKSLLSSRSHASLGNVIRNFIGLTAEPTVVTVQLRPVIRVAGVAMSVPKSIPIKFTYGGKTTEQQ